MPYFVFVISMTALPCNVFHLALNSAFEDSLRKELPAQVPEVKVSQQHDSSALYRHLYTLLDRGCLLDAAVLRSQQKHYPTSKACNALKDSHTTSCCDFPYL